MATASRLFVLRNDVNAKQLYAFLKANWRAMADAGRPIALTAQEYKSKRSIEQNKRYWAILNQISEHAWLDGRQYSTAAWHAYFAAKFIGCEDLPGGGLTAISTTTLSIEEFCAYSTRVEVYAIEELGVELQ